MSQTETHDFLHYFIPKLVLIKVKIVKLRTNFVKEKKLSNIPFISLYYLWQIVIFISIYILKLPILKNYLYIYIYNIAL